MMIGFCWKKKNFLNSESLEDYFELKWHLKDQQRVTPLLPVKYSATAKWCKQVFKQSQYMGRLK